MRKQIWFTLMALVSLSSCAVQIHDAQFCSPIPGTNLAACDWFLHSDAQLVDWNAMQASWIAKGQAVECTQSATFGDLKSELEKLCSKTNCNWPIAAVSPTPTPAPTAKTYYEALHGGLEKIESLGKHETH